MKRRARLGGLRLLLLLACVGGAGCRDLPRDPKQTLRGVVEGRRLRVGLVENPPWVIRTAGEPAGAEAELVRQLASELGATPEWHWGGEQRHMEALEHYELDLVAGGITDKTPWSKSVGLTGPFYEERYMVGVPASMPMPESLKGLGVTAEAGGRAAAELEREGAKVARVGDISHAAGAVAGPSWKLEQMGFTPTRFELYRERHVLAVPPGENAWIKRLEEFLGGRRPLVAGLLKQEETKR